MRLRTVPAFTDAASLLDCRYEVMTDGEVVKSADLELPAIPALGKKKINLIGLPKFEGKDSYIRFIFTSKEDTLWCKKGFEISFDQVQLSAPEGADEEAEVLRKASFLPELPGQKIWQPGKRDAKGVQENARAEIETLIKFARTAEKHNENQNWQEAFHVKPESTKVALGSKLSVEATGLRYTITSGNMTYSFNRRSGVFDSIKNDKKEILKKPMAFNFMRAPLDNDPMRGEWFGAHLHDYEVKVFGSRIEPCEDGKSVRIIVDQGFVWSIHQPFLYGSVTYTIGRGLSVAFDFTATRKIFMLPRIGLRLFLDKSFDKVEYFGYGPTESYIDKHQATWLGKFKAKVSDLYEPYIRPQENSSHYGCRYVKLTGRKLSLICSGSNPKTGKCKNISFNASEYTQEELWTKRHNFELEKSGCTVFCIDYKMAGVGSNSCGPALATKYRIQLPEVKGQLNIDFVE